MEFNDQRHKGTRKDTEPSPNLTINHLPDEVLLEIFDSYRQSTALYDHIHHKYVWLNLTRVCTKWRAIMLMFTSRLDLSITVGPQKPGHIKTVLSSPLPISLEYNLSNEDITQIGSVIWRMRAALRCRDRVREISFGWPPVFVPFNINRRPTKRSVVLFDNFIRATNFHFPALERLTLYFIYLHEVDIPATFFRGPKQSDLRLQSLRLHDAPLASLSGLIMSATALTDFALITRKFDWSQRSFLLKCLQGMKCLCNLFLIVPYDPRDSQSQHSHSTPKDIVSLSNLTHFNYFGPAVLLNNLTSGLSTPSLRVGSFELCDSSPILYLSRFIEYVRDEFRSIAVHLGIDCFRLFSFSSIHSAKIHFERSFELTVACSKSLGSMKSISCTPSTKFAMVEELELVFISPSIITKWEKEFSLWEFLCQFRSVRVLHVDPFFGHYLQREDEHGIFPLLEEIEVPVQRSTGDSDEEYQRRAAKALAAFGPFVSARKRAGSFVKLNHYLT